MMATGGIGVAAKERDLLAELNESIEAVCNALVQRMQIVASSDEKVEELAHLYEYLRIAQITLLKYMVKA